MTSKNAKGFFLYKNFVSWLKTEEKSIVIQFLRGGIFSGGRVASTFDLLYKIKERINTGADSISISILKIPEKLKTLTQVHNDANETFEKLEIISKELAFRSGELNESVSSITEELSVSENISTATQILAENLQEEQIVSLAIIMDITEKSHSLLEENTRLQGDINALNSSIKMISEHTSLVKGISDQTNLLALNASIEAARAGDHGRGFSVVAEGVSRLADKSSETVKMIDNAVKEIHRTFQNWQISTLNYSDKLKEIIKNIDVIQDKTNRNKISSEKTSAVMNELSESLENISLRLDEIKLSSIGLTEMGTEIVNQTSALEDTNSILNYSIREMFEFVNDSVESITAQNPVWLLQFVINRRIDHMLWFKNVNTAIAENDSGKFPELDHTKCNMGLWYYNTVVSNIELERIHQSMEEPHLLIHQAAKEIRNCITNHDQTGIAEAAKSLQKQYETITALFNEYENYLERLILNNLQV